MARTVGLTFSDMGRVRIPCPYCEKTYANAETLARHIEEKHQETQQPEE